ncbi:Phenoxybenzoate dioxygenase subunit beta [Paraburkholderia ultramafica]|uniref:Phenoxybenzoate dioxygenase subunit beta n=1 Tax=Paraburkholderia ultramafica TaxID=1544867 RepID=A0A6S7C3H2_9BURK|nr:PDR/VanB family oxidoreductase [Paraburkholderia ultramafica]CAB3800540.1 Phenoxybenzoate dioxygenase subunit beta [Paraburkholderia ultramafica]
MDRTITLEVTNVRCEARDVMVLELRDLTRRELPPFTAGSHLELKLSTLMRRHYSLCNDPDERGRYCIGVGLAKESRGGSKFIHEHVRVGSRLEVSTPRNNFAFVDSGDASVFVAGGIGITPIMSMIRRCESIGKPWQLYYCTRSRQRTAFYEELTTFGTERCKFHFDDEEQGRFFDAGRVTERVGPNSHIYCCGPTALMEAVKSVTAKLDDDQVHFEWFTSTETLRTDDRPFFVTLKSSGERYEIPIGESILDVLERHDHLIPFSCREGLCATCKTCVVSGVPDHRDQVMSESEKARNDQILICVSRAKSDELVLDL